MTQRPLRPRQQQALHELRATISSGCKRVILQMATGAGKTRLAAEVVALALGKGNRSLFTVPAVSLVDQTVLSFYEEGLRDIGVIQADHAMTDMSKPIQIASVQTLMRREFEPGDVVILDEVHRWFKFYEQLLAREDMQDVPVIGLSATPWTKGLGKHFQKLVVSGTIAEGIAEGWLSKYRAFAPMIPDLKKVRTVADDYHQGDLSRVMNLAPLTASIVDTWRLYGQGRPTFCFAVDRAHAKSLQREFDEIGVSTAYVDAFTPLTEREEIRKRFESDEVEIVFNVGVLTTGIDWDVRCIILARPTKSEMLHVQQIGRGLRTTPDGKEEKDHLLLLDHAGACLKLGLVDDIFHEKLDDGTKAGSLKKDKPAPKPTRCPKCHFLKPAKVAVCPACGFKPERQSNRVPVEGSLMEITGGRRADPDTKREWYAMLKAEQERKGYKAGWIGFKYREVFKEEAPSHFRNMPPREPSSEVLSWLLSQRIRYIKGQQKRKAS